MKKTEILVVGISVLLAACQATAAAEPTSQPSATAAAAEPTNPAPTEAPTEMAPEVPMGEALFKTRFDGLPIGGYACVDCHTFGTLEVWAPSVGTIVDNADTRVEGLAAEDYLRQSILEPGAHIAGEFAYSMPVGYAEVLTEAQIDSLVEFILSQ